MFAPSFSLSPVSPVASARSLCIDKTHDSSATQGTCALWCSCSLVFPQHHSKIKQQYRCFPNLYRERFLLWQSPLNHLKQLIVLAGKKAHNRILPKDKTVVIFIVNSITILSVLTKPNNGRNWKCNMYLPAKSTKFILLTVSQGMSWSNLACKRWMNTYF